MRNDFENNEYDFSIIRIILSVVIIIASIFTISIVIINVSNIKILDGITIKGEEVKLTIDTEKNAEEFLFVSDEKGLRCKKEDGSFARDEWIEKNGELFYFDTSGYGKNGDMKYQGQVYTLDNGKLKKIIRDKSYNKPFNKDYYSSIDSMAFMVYLDEEQNANGYHTVKYKMYADNDEGILGTEGDPQYSSPFMLNVCENLVYYLAVGKKATYAGVLYRMRPNASLKEYVGTNVEGYIVLNGDTIYYYDGSRIIKAKSWKEKEVKIIDETETENIEDLPLPDEVISEGISPTGRDEDIADILETTIKDIEKETTETIETKKKDEKNAIKETINGAPPIETRSGGNSVVREKETEDPNANIEHISLDDLPLPLPIGD